VQLLLVKLVVNDHAAAATLAGHHQGRLHLLSVHTVVILVHHRHSVVVVAVAVVVLAVRVCSQLAVIMLRVQKTSSRLENAAAAKA